MKVINQMHHILKITENALEKIELAGRTCYKSEAKITPESSKKFVKMLIDRGHHSVIEHPSATVKFITDRGVTHELVRHRLASFSQESTRYCNYGGDNITFIRPVWCDIVVLADWDDDKYIKTITSIPMAESYWLKACLSSEFMYKRLLNAGWRPEEARSVLNNSLKTEIVVTANLREWRHILKLRCSKAAHPQIRELMLPLLKEFKAKLPIIFDDIEA